MFADYSPIPPWLGQWTFWFPTTFVAMLLAMLVYLWRHRHDGE